MSLFVLNQGYRVVATETGGRVVHERTGDALALTPAEIQLLARASSGGLEAADPTLQPLVKKFAALKVLVKAASLEPQTQASPAKGEVVRTPPPPLTPTQLVPCFRGDLKIVPKGKGGTFDVSDPTNAKTFSLYDFEVSLSRMLDGCRTVKDVIQDGQRLGIPVDLDSLGQFLRQLERYGFLSAPGSRKAVEGDTSRGPRKNWDDGVRTLYQSGLRTFRRGRYSEALAYFEAILQQDPENPEALEMLEKSRQCITATASLPSRFTELPDPSEEFEIPLGVSPPSPANESPPVASPPPSVVAPPPVASPAPPVASPPPSVAAPPPPPVALSQPSSTKVRSKARPWLLLGALLFIAASGGVASFVDLPALLGLGKPASGPKPVAILAPPTAPPAEIPKVELDKGALAAAAIEPTAVEPNTQAAQLDHDAGVPMAPPAVTADSWVVSKIDRRGRVKMGELVAPASGTLSWMASPEQRIARKDVVGSVRDGTGKNFPLAAPKSGLLFPKLSEGAAVAAGDVVAAILYHEAFLQTVVTGDQPQTSWRCEVADEASGQSAPCHVVSAVPRGAGFFVTATVEPTWFDKAAAPKLRLSPAPP